MIYIGIIILICVIYFLVIYNKLVKLNNNVKESFATMDVYLKKRWDLIPNLVEVVKGYAKHEKDTLMEIVQLRSGIYDNLSQEEKIDANKKLNESISRLMIIAESYPELKANEGFLSLNNELIDVEDEIAQSRKYFNAVVKNYNNLVEMIPSNIIAKILGYKTKTMFEAKVHEKENIKIDL